MMMMMVMMMMMIMVMMMISARLPDILATPTLKEKQVHALYNANDYIRYTQVR